MGLLNKNTLKQSDNFIYLGIYFVKGLFLNVCCKNRIIKFMASVSSVFHFVSVGYESVFAELLSRKSLSALMCGLDTVPRDSDLIQFVTLVWNCAFW